MSAPFTRSVLIITSAANQAAYNAVAHGYGWGPNTFSHPLYPAGGPYLVPTAYVCRPLMRDADYQALAQQFSAHITAGVTHIFDFETTTYAQALASLKLADAPAVVPVKPVVPPVPVKATL